MSRIFSHLSLATLIFAIGMLTGCQKSNSSGAASNTANSSSPIKTKRIILLTNGDDPFWDAMRAGMEKAAADFDLDADGLKVVMDKNDATPEGQVDKLRQYLGQTDIAAVGISVIDPNNAAMASAMTELRKQGTVVVTIDSDVNRDRFKDTRFAYLGTKNTFGGRQMGLAAKKLRSDGGKYATFYGIEGVANVIERNSGFADGAGENFTRAVGVSDGMDHNVAQDNVRNALENYPDINTLVGIWAYNAHAIVTVVKERKIRDQTKIVIFDAAPLAIQHLKDGMVDAMVVQDPYGMGYEGTRLMRALYKEDVDFVKTLYPAYDASSKSFTSPEGDIRHTDVRVVVPDNSELKAGDFDPEVKFFTITEFDSWLSERGLSGS